uniref:Uncharacterized protein n=1 Tax=Anguilla anguilla TaxID=7936 RepID=A0A0E9TY53_ANGAN
MYMYFYIAHEIMMTLIQLSPLAYMKSGHLNTHTHRLTNNMMYIP